MDRRRAYCLWLGLVAAACDFRSDEQILRDALEGTPGGGLVQPSSPQQPTASTPTLATGPKTVSGKLPEPLATEKRERLDLAPESWASDGDVVAYSEVSFGTKGSLWLLANEDEPVALTEPDAYSPTPIRLTDAEVEFLDNPASDPSKVYPPDPDGDPIRLMSVPRSGGKAVEVASLKAADLVARSGAWTFSPAGQRSTTRDRTPLVAYGPGRRRFEIRSGYGERVQDILVAGRTLYWTAYAKDTAAPPAERLELWSTTLDDRGRPAVAESPLFTAPYGPSGPIHLAQLGEALFILSGGSQSAYFRDAKLSRWDPGSQTLVPLVEGIDATGIEGLTAMADLVCWSDDYGDSGLYCYRPSTDQLLEVSRKNRLGRISSAVAFAGGIIWSERPKGGAPKTFVAKP